ncbi:MAG: thioredoxin family protein [Sphingomonadaceae bacterium]|nr:thioredoxin family protein [Sphingomonadaceae bacterium]
MCRAIWAIFRLLSRLLLPCLLLAGGAAVAQGLNPTNHIRAELLAENAIAPRQSGSIAILMTPDAGWHGYWVNGGDAGFGMQLTWDNPAGVAITPLEYPVPSTLVISGLMNHVYERPYALLARITLPPDAVPGSTIALRARAQWLACTDKVCVPESAELSLDLPVAAGQGGGDPRFAAWRAALPQALGAPGSYQTVGDNIRFALPLPRTLVLRAPRLFVESPNIVAAGAAQSFWRDGDRLIVEMGRATGRQAAAGTIRGLLRIADGRALQFDAQAGNVAAGGTLLARIPSAREGGDGGAADGADSNGNGNGNANGNGGAFGWALFLSALGGAILGGLILNIMPCVFPILSLKALALARAGGEQVQVQREGLAYAAGTVITAMLLGAILMLLRAGGEALGWAFQLQRPESVILLIVLMGVVAANLAGLFEFTGLSFSMRPKTAVAGGGDDGARGAFLTGALAAFVATPCTGPFMGAALGATLTLPVWAALPIFGGLGLGLALPFLAIAFIPPLRARLPRPGAWMVTLRRWLALPMALTALALVWLLSRQVGMTGWWLGGGLLVAVAAIAYMGGRAQRDGGAISPYIFVIAALIVPASLLLPAATTATHWAISTRGAAPWSAAARDAALADGHAVFVDFTADWCLTCKVNEAAAIDRAETRAAFARHGVVVLIGDWTNGDPAITAELARHGRNSLPLYLWYPAGAHEPEILPQILTPAMLMARAERSPAR